MSRAAIRTPDQRLRVFLSSTLGELAEERHAARAAIEQLRLTPVMFELGARPHPPRALYRSYLAQSDVFVAVYWQRYGWIAPDMEISGLEDELVLSDGMPRLVYVKRPAPEMESGLAHMLERLQTEDTASYKPFTDAEELQGLLLDDLAILLTERFDDRREVQSVEHERRHNLPAQTSTFLGRESEVRDLGALLADEGVRLVTLTGPGGTGKTRLALRVAADEVEHFGGDVVFVDLSAESEADDAYAAIARAVNVTVSADAGPLIALEDELRDRRALLLLDNFEQVIPAAVGVVDLLERCPAVQVLVTSREALRVRGEHAFPVPPLSLPDPGDTPAAATSEAVRLFCDRAAAVQASFGLGDENVEAITAICRRLDGLPLAIELAAARVSLFDVDDLRARLEDRLDVLAGGARDLPKRQQTLRDAIAWSYDLLAEPERAVLKLFSVFTTARLADVEQTAWRIPALEGFDAIEPLGSLVDKSLVRSAPGAAGRPRLSMLVTIRAFALDQLETDPELAAAARRAHAEHYTEVALRLRQQLTSAERRDVLAALADEFGNLRTAWDEWVAAGDVARLNDLLATLWGYYDARGDYRSAVELGNDLLVCLAALPDSPERRRDEFALRMSVVRTELAVRGFTPEAELMICDALAQTDEGGDARQRFPGLRSLASLHMMRADFEQTGTVADEVMLIARAEQDPLLLAEAHLLAGVVAGWRDGVPASIEHYDKAVEYVRASRPGYVEFRVGPHPGVTVNAVTALSYWLVGRPDTAMATMQAALDLAGGLDHPYSMAYALHHAGLLDLWRLDLAGVAARADAVLTIAEAHDYPTWTALAHVFGGLAMVASGDADTGLARLEAGFEQYKGLSAPPVFFPALLMIRASALGMAGRSQEGLAVIEQSAALVSAGDPVAPDVGIVQGDLLLSLSPSDVPAAEAAFERAVELAEARGARMPQLQALTRLAGIRRGTPGAAASVRALREVYETFTEGRDTVQLTAAWALLGE